jgi:hypothetical protein
MKLVLLLLTLVLTSCVIPITRQVIVGEDMRGRVIDVESGFPIVGAIIGYKGVRDFETRSDLDGYFFLVAQTKRRTYWMPPAPVDPPPWAFDAASYVVLIKADGHELGSFERVKDRIVAKRTEDLGATKKEPEYIRFALKRK